MFTACAPPSLCPTLTVLNSLSQEEKDNDSDLDEFHEKNGDNWAFFGVALNAPS